MLRPIANTPPNAPPSASRRCHWMPKQTAEVIELIKGARPPGEEAFLLDLLTHRVPPGVDDAAKVRPRSSPPWRTATWPSSLVSKAKATELLGTMVGGYNVHPLIELLDDADVAAIAAEGLKKTLLMFDFFNDVAAKARRATPRPGSDAVLGRRRVVHLPPEGAEVHHRHRVQGARRDQHRRPLARARRLEPPGHPAALPGDAEEHRPDAPSNPEGRQARPDAVHRRPEEEGPPGRLRRRRGRHRLCAQERHQQRDLGHRPGHPLRAEQALRRRHAGRQDRADLLQHAGRLRLAAHREST